MAHQQIEQRTPELYGVIGTMDFENAATLEKEGFEVLDEVKGRLILDFSSVERVNSAGAVILLSWLRYALKTGKGIEFQRLPEQFLKVLEVSDLMEILPINLSANPSA